MNKEFGRNLPLAETVRHWVTSHIASSGKEVVDLHQLVIEQMGMPLLTIVMANYRYTQSRAAKVLGMGRHILRQLLIKYFDDQYCGRTPSKELQ